MRLLRCNTSFGWSLLLELVGMQDACAGVNKHECLVHDCLQDKWQKQLLQNSAAFMVKACAEPFDKACHDAW